MGSVDPEQLLAPISAAEPSGSNLEYDPGFTALERAAQGRPEQRMGDAVVAAEPPDWSAVMDRCLALLQRTHDLRVAVHLTLALLQRSGCPGLADGLGVLGAMLTGYWETVHPELDREDNNDPTMRINALAALAAPDAIQGLRSAPLVWVRTLGAIALKDLQIGGETPTMDAATIEGVFQEVDFTALEALVAAARRAGEALAAIDATFELHTGARGPDLGPLAQVLREITRSVEPRLAARRAALGGTDAEVEDGTAVGFGEGGPAPLAGAALSGEIRSRDDVIRAIDKIFAYYARFEPASPLPLLLERCKRLVGSSFLEIIRDLTPESVARVEGLAGRKPE